MLPGTVREMPHLQPGDDFEVTVEDDETITLRRIARSANQGLVDLLLSFPATFEVPPRECDDSQALKL